MAAVIEHETTADFDPGAPRGPSRLEPGVTFGVYRLERAIGHGGMGEVWLARRTDGLYDTHVAIKTLHAHLTRAEDRERFAREARILGRLSHPHIARLLDAGVTSEGQLYLVLEYVEGQRIDRWCDAQRLDIPARLRLFLDVCDAIAHAHAHLVVHRDVKPGNMLVTTDGVAKLLDFGIAKLLEADAASGEPLTQLGGRALTPEYAAPEQLTGDAVTTATDIYAMGVVLYALLSGASPYGATRSSPALLEQEIVAGDPRPLGAALATTQTATGVAESRRTTPAHLRQALRGDLQTIVAKALKKVPAERYGSAAALADDVRRYLAHQPVTARPDRLAYRLRKFVRRNRVAVAAAVVVALALAGGVAGMAWQAQRARDEAAKATAVKDFLLDVFRTTEIGSGNAAAAQQTTARQLLERGGDKLLADRTLPPAVRLELLTVLGELHGNLRLNDRAERLQAEAVQVARRTLGPTHEGLAYALVDLGMSYGNHARFRESSLALEEAVRILEARRRTDYVSYPAALYQLGFNAYQLGRNADALGYLQRSVAIYEGGQPREAMRQAAHRWLGQTYARLERFGDAEAEFRTAMKVSVELYGAGDYRTAAAHYTVGELFQRLDRVDAAEPELRTGCETFATTIGRDHPNTFDCWLMLGRVQHRLGRRAEGRALMLSSLEAAARPVANPDSLERSQMWLALSDLDEGDLDHALERVRVVIPRWEKSKPASLPLAGALHVQGVVLTERGDYAGAGASLERAQEIRARQLGEKALVHRETLAAQGALALARGEVDKARSLLDAAMRLADPRAAPGLVDFQATVDLVRIRLAEQQWDRAVDAARLVLRDLDRGITTRHRELAARVRIAEGRGLLALGRRDEARAVLTRSVGTLASLQIPSSPWLRDARAALAACEQPRGSAATR
jgi:tetratricopeptide (TPR) repeat protein/tRNA A-37 threonylcarbamoyl transferase component Bud32